MGTRTFDELYFKRQVPLSQVVWVHLSEAGPLMKESVARVRAEVDTYYARKCPDVTFNHVAIENRNGGHPLDTKTQEDLEAVMFTLYREISKWKREHYTIHLSISGGRKVLSALGVAAAQLTFESDEDKCWHMLSDESLPTRAQMHSDDDDQNHLIPVPVLRWSSWKGLVDRSLAEVIAQDPFHAQEIAAQLNASSLLEWRRHFVEKVLRDDERDVLRLISLRGYENKEIDKHAHRSCKNMTTRIWNKYCRYLQDKRLDLGYEENNLKRGKLIVDFHLVFEQMEREKERTLSTERVRNIPVTGKARLI